MSDIEKMIATRFDEAMRDVLTHAAFMHDTTGSQDSFIDVMERLLHYLGITAVTAAQDDKDLRDMVVILHERVDDIICKMAADVRRARAEVKK